MMGGRKKVIIGNWKMHFTLKQASAFANKLASKEMPSSVTIAVAPTTLSLGEVSQILGPTNIAIAAQNAYYQDEGAFTGETSMPMLRGVAKYVLVGHSERRHVFHESNDLIRHKMAAAVRSGIIPILCIGETLMERQHFHTKHVIVDQLTHGLADLTAEEVAKVIVAYEPVWAISNGKNYAKHKAAVPEDAHKAAQVIRKNAAELYGKETADKLRVLYGGSSNSENATAFLQTEGIDGLLVGGASLSLSEFMPIVQQAARLSVTKIKVA